LLGDHATPGAAKYFGITLLLAATLVAPFIAVELVSRRAYHEDFPFVLFTFMSLHALLIAVLMTPALRRLVAERSLRALGPRQWAGLALGVFLIVVYANVVIDQLPCFLGVPNCD
jgi:hypothetical protein